MSVDLASYVEAWRRRWADAEREDARLAAEALALVPRLSRHRNQRYGARRVFLFGSLAEGFFRSGSDIDLAVEALPKDASFFRAAADLDDLAKPFRVDLVPLEDAYPEVRERILTRGREIHDGTSD
jgi:predicted nucleotidyltransferase